MWKRLLCAQAMVLGGLGLSTLPAHALDLVTGAWDLGTISAPSAQTVSRAFNDLDPGTPGLQLAGVPVSVSSTDVFYEDWAFKTTGATFNSITATIDLDSIFGISNLQARLYRGSLATTSTGPVGPALITAWSSQLLTSSGGTGNVQVISPINLAAGDYVFEVRGNVTGTVGGSFAGALNFASPVPEPEALTLAAVGLLALWGAARRNTPSGTARKSQS